MDAGKGHFTFGVEMSPKWFLDKVASMDVEYTERGHSVIVGSMMCMARNKM